MKKIGILKAIKLCRDYEKSSPEKKRTIQNQRLHDIVSYARRNSMFYKSLYNSVSDTYQLSDLPPTNKITLMNHWNDWVCDPDLVLEDVMRFMENTDNIGRKLHKKYFVFTTSGSTGNPLVAIYDKSANNIMGGIAACRSYARKEDLSAFIRRGGKSIGVFADGGFYLGNSSIRSRLITMPWKKKQLAVSSALYPISKIVRQLNEFQPDMLGGYPSNLSLLIQEAKEGRLNISPVIIMTGGEYLSDDLREALAETFHCYVQTSYSCTEGGTVACECRYRHFHINEDWIILEPVDKNGDPVEDGVLSDKVYLTNLYNYVQPYIRYEITDRVIMHHEPCSCGNSAPWIELEGRSDDVTTFTENDEQISIAPLSFYAVLKEVPGLRRFQMLVFPENQIELRLEALEDIEKQNAFTCAKKKLQDFLESQGIFHSTVTQSGELPLQHPVSGKYKHVINMQQE